ncbi:hypothetical protein [Amycolatopsis sp. NPDC051102]|uniref:hypothetical protein n=1 Tax=Amycolatopsis sp. NPDC051102 TaxID=3155163 RepID=UPI003416F1C0
MTARGPRPPAPAALPAVGLRGLETPRPGPSDVVRARALLGNAAVTAAMSGLPGGAEPRLSAWTTQLLLAGQNLVGNQAVANQATALAPAKPAPAPKKPSPAKPTARKTEAQPAPAPDKKDLATGKTSEQRQEKPEKGTGPRSPGADPKFHALKKDVTAKKKAIGASHPPAAAEAAAPQDAAEAPADDQEARGKAAHAEDMDAARPKEFDKQEFIQAVKKAVADKAPKNLDEADKFGESGKAEEIKTEVQGKVGEGTDASAREIAETTAAPPEPAPDAKQVVPMAADKVPARPGTPDPAQAAPDRLPPSATDLSAGPDQVNRQMAEAQVTDQQLSFKNSREPQFDKAVNDKKTMEAHSETAPKKLRAHEGGELDQVKNTAATRGSAAMAGIHAARVATGRQVGTGKQATKKTDEDKRKEVTDLLQKVFDQTKCDVEKILTDLDKKVDDQFTTQEKQARDRFTREHEDGMERYKDERYSGPLGWARWTNDLFAGLPEEANRIYEHARDNYLAAMDRIITEIADTVGTELKRAKDRIATGRNELKAAVDKLPADLKAIGREAATDFESKFDELTDTVDDKGTELVDTLATKYTDAVKAVDDEIAAEKEKNKGLVAKAAEAIGGAITAILELGRMLLGVLRKAVSAIGAILKDPIGFLGNLVTGVGGGLKLFMKNAGRHLEAGVLAWLLGTGATMGLQLPKTFDLLGILSLIAAILGLSWPNIRARLARKVPNQALVAAETAVPLVAEVKRRGVAGMWDDLKTRVGDLKKDLIGNLVSYLLPTIIVAGITWIVSLFNPASAFIRACKMIIDIIRFIVTNARQIIEFVNAVLDAVLAIARGGTGGVPALVERALARAIPVLIGALAALLGIGGIAGKVKEVFQKLARPVNRAIDWVIDKIVGLVKKLWSKIKPKRHPKKTRPRRPRRPDGRRRTRKPRRDRPLRPRDATKPGKPDKDKRDRPAKDAVAKALREAKALAHPGASVADIDKKLPSIRRKHKIKRLSLIIESFGPKKTTLRFAGSNSPEEKSGPVNLWHKTYDGIRHLVELTKGVDRLVTRREPMEDGSSEVELLTFATGEKAIRKVAFDETPYMASATTAERRSMRSADDRAEAERLGFLVARAIGTPVPAAFRYSETELLMDYVQGTRGRTLHGNTPELERLMATGSGRRLGLLDALIGNEDRNPGNFMIVNGEVVGIDQGEAWSEAGKNLSGWTHKTFARAYYDFKNNRWRKNDLSRAEIDQFESALQALRSEFLPYRSEWYDDMMKRFAEIKKQSRWGE